MVGRGDGSFIPTDNGPIAHVSKLLVGGGGMGKFLARKKKKKKNYKSLITVCEKYRHQNFVLKESGRLSHLNQNSYAGIDQGIYLFA